MLVLALNFAQDVWPWLEMGIALVTVVLAARIWLQVRQTRTRLRRGVAGPKVVVNLSGHPIAASEGGWAAEYRIDDRPVRFAADTPAALAASVRETLHHLDADVRARLACGDPNVVVALPGLAPATAHLLVEVHGLAGHFPRITYAVGGPPFVYVRPVDLQDIRNAARWRRGGGEEEAGPTAS